MQQLQLSDSDWAEWLAHPVTQAVRAALGKRVLDLQEGWLAGSYTADPVLNSKAIGEAQALKSVLDLTPELVNQENSND